jgi:hypothetical protein
MNFSVQRHNLYLLTLSLGLTLAVGCATHNKEDKEVAALRVHLQSSENVTASQTVSVLRSNPLSVPIFTDPILTEANLTGAALLDTPGGFAVEVQFNQTGALTLEQFTASNPGKHLVIFGQWSEKVTDARWLAVPLITKRIASGTLSFTPDCSRAEAEKFVKGLKNSAKKNFKNALK